ncbi:MAG: hypothetical protein EVA89_33870 [Sandaracinaceae bacterium]|nr:MAG: hypothetical protein EVA89_33870 [Sandaracinaceae bacterium]
MRWLILTSTLLVFACDGEAPAPDAGPRDAQVVMDSGPAEPCTADRECDDDLFCTVHRCLPGNPAGDARGCVMVDDPCAPGEVCDEAMDRCATETCGPDPDADGDGVDSIACGGIDCDDDDEFRFPGNAEVCDAMGHDEDCTDETVAGATDGDLDEDGFTSALCCNGANCGDDCDDDDRSVFPGARELCNGRDDDCDGMTDEEPPGADPLCPGGTCSAGRCDLAGWDRTLGGGSSDQGSAVAMDALGNVYVVGAVDGAADFGLGSEPGFGGRDAYIAAFGADGSYRWHRRYGGSATDEGFGVSVDDTTNTVYVTGAATGAFDLGGGVRSGSGPRAFLLALQTDGTYRWDRVFGFSTFMTTEATAGRVYVAGFASSAVDLGGGSRPITGTSGGFVAAYDQDDNHIWDRVFSGAAGTTVLTLVSHADAAGVLIAGGFAGGAVDFGTGPLTSGANDDLYAAALDPDGTTSWVYTRSGSDDSYANAARRLPSGEVIIGGVYDGTIDFGGGPRDAPGLFGWSYLVRLSATGAHLADRVWGGDGGDVVNDIAVTSSGDIVAVGRFAGTVNFGGGTRTATGSTDMYIVTYAPTFAHRSDRVFGSTGSNEARSIAIGPADSTAVVGAFFERIDLGSGLRTAEGETDAFVVRLPN